MRPHPKKILFVINSLNYGGAESHLVNIASQLKKRGFFPEVFVLQYIENKLSKQLSQLNIPIHSSSFFSKGIKVNKINPLTLIRLLVIIIELRDKLFKIKPTFIHSYLPAAYISISFASCSCSKVVKIMSRRSLNRYQKRNSLGKIEKWLHPKMDVITGNSKAVIDELRQEGVQDKQLKLIYNGVNIETTHRFSNSNLLRKQLKINSHSLIFIIVANLIAYKGHQDLIKAFSLIKKELPNDWKLLVIGRDDGIGHHLKIQIKEAGLNDHIKLLGYQENIQDYLNIADIGILCSHEEGFSNALLESMAASLPMIVTDVGGNKEAVIDGQTGFVVPSHKPKQLAKAILTMAKSSKQREMGKKARERVETFFSMDACVDAYEKLYQEALSTKSSKK